MESKDNRYDNNKTPINNNSSPHNYHSQHFSHSQNTGNINVNSSNTPRQSNLVSVNKALQNEFNKKEQELLGLHNKFMTAIQRQEDEYSKRRNNNGTTEKSQNFDDYSTLYGSDTEEDECIKDLENNIKSAEKNSIRKT